MRLRGLSAFAAVAAAPLIAFAAPPVAHREAVSPVTALFGVSADSPADAWAVGGPDALHWDGSTWTAVPIPSQDSSCDLNAVDAESPDSAWAVGGCTVGSRFATLALYWDGSSWTQVPTPSPGHGDNTLAAVSADSATDAWAVGFAPKRGVADAAVALHWNGSTWTAVPTPGVGPLPGGLDGVAALSPTDAWASYSGNPSGVLHWDGTAWTKVTSSQPPAGGQYYGVAAGSADDVWAAGFILQSTGGDATLVKLWDGTAWTRTPTPSPHLLGGATLEAVSADSPGDAWAVGTVGDGGHTLILHWDGTSWARVPAPSPAMPFLRAVSADSATDAWAVGYEDTTGSQQALMLHWNGTAWSSVSP